MSVLVSSAILVGSCQTTSSGGKTISGVAVTCASFQPIYWSRLDTPKTVAQVKEYNAVGKALCGWGK